MNEKGLPLEKKLSLDNVINEPSETSTDYINKLPCECLARIFMYLDIFDRIEIRKICKNWKDTCDNFAWYDIKKFVCHASIENLSIYPHPFDDEFLSCAVEEKSRRTNNTLLTISMWAQPNQELKYIESLSPLLEFIDS